MIEDTEWVIEILYTAKTIYDGGRWERFTEELSEFDDFFGGDFTCKPEYAPIFYGCADSCVFETAKFYYNSEKKVDTIVFWDPLMYRYNKLCREYEARHGIVEIENPYVDAALQALHKAMNFDDYCYDYQWCTGTKNPKDSKLVFLEFQEFCSAWAVSRGLVELREYLIEGVSRLEAELAPKKKNKKSKLIKLPTPAPAPQKEAA